MMKGLKKWRLLSLLAVLTVFLAGCGQQELSTLLPAGQVGKDQFKLLMLASGIMLLVIIVVVVIYVLALIRFGRKKRGEDFIPEQTEGSQKLELVWTIIPIILITILAVPTVYYTYKLGDVKAMEEVDDDGNAKHLVVDVKANLYWWEFSYPDLGIVTAQELVVPTKEKVYFNLKAADVKHSFWIPAIGGKLDTNVENLNKFYLTFDQESKDLKDGVFYGKCAELCGPSHALMDFKVKTLPRDEFNTWVKNMKATADKTEVANADGEEVFKSSCIGCHANSGAGEGGIMSGPNLAAFGDRNRVAGFLDHDKEHLKEWIKNPQKLKPGNEMPSFEKQLSDQEIDDLAEYLLGLSVEQ